jgi:aryl-alcohol dehydrogenase-like predicted oxidoreductase
MSRQLGLGTVQFGMPYGVANTTGQVTVDEAARILATAREAGMDTLDTASAYGESERRLGEIGVRGWRVVSKLPPLPDGTRDIAHWVRTEARQSLTRLRLERLTGLLLHRSSDLARHGDHMYEALDAIRREGLVEKIGVSIYHPEELDALDPRHAIGLVQAPLNVLDRRLVTSGWLARLTGAGVEVHTRSVFLQGLLLMPRDGRPQSFDRWSSLWDRWQAWLTASGLTPVEASLAYVRAIDGVDRIIVGVDTAHQLNEILGASRAHVPSFPDDLVSMDLALISPSGWSLS